MEAVTWPLPAPFRGFVPTPSVGSSQPMLAYALRMMAERKAHIGRAACRGRGDRAIVPA